MQRFECVHDAEIEPEFPRKWPAKVEILTKAGQRFTARMDFPKGDPENPLSWDELIDKFHRLTAGVFPKGQRQRLIAHVRKLEDAPAVSDVLRLAAK
jgi:2-methylcitrate dehydratase PrpD